MAFGNDPALRKRFTKRGRVPKIRVVLNRDRGCDFSGPAHQIGELVGVRSILDGSRRHTDDRRHRRHVACDHRARADDRLEPDANVLHDRRADADECTALDGDVTREAHTGADVHGRADHRLVIDDAAGVENGIVADLTVRTNHRAGGNDDAAADGSVAGELCRRVNRREHLKAVFVERLRHGAADAVVADGDDCGADAARVQFGQSVEIAEDGQTVDPSAAQLEVAVNESDGFVLLGLLENIEHDSSVSARAEDDEFHGVLQTADRRALQAARLNGQVYQGVSVRGCGALNRTSICRVENGAFAGAKPRKVREKNMGWG